ncbi:MAG: 50S ribosomal protein L34 [Sedimentisphaerales bacterium]
MFNHRKSKIKRRRKSGFLVRMQTSKGRKMINRKRRVGRSVSVRKTMK